MVCRLVSERRPEAQGLPNRTGSSRLPESHAAQVSQRGKNESERTRVAHALAPYILKWQQPQQRSLGRNYLWAAKALVAVGGRLLVRSIAPIDVFETVASWDKLAHSTRFARAAALSYVLRLLEKAHGAPPGLADAVPKVGKPSPRNVTATMEERAALLAASPPHLRLVLLLCSDLAIRSGTAIRAAPEHYDPDTRTISLRTKYGRAVTLPVSEPLREMFAQHKGPATLPYYAWFTPRHGRGDTLWRRAFAKVKRELGITRRLTPHDLRRTTAVLAYETTRDLRTVQALLGHKELAHTLYYLDHNATTVSPELIELLRSKPATERLQ